MIELDIERAVPGGDMLARHGLVLASQLAAAADSKA